MVNCGEVLFQCEISRPVYNSEEFRVYAAIVDKEKFPDIKHTKYGTVSIFGYIHELGKGILYEVIASEETNKNGIGYRVKNIRRNRPESSYDMQLFLAEILTPRQAYNLYDAYPDIRLLAKPSPQTQRIMVN